MLDMMEELQGLNVDHRISPESEQSHRDSIYYLKTAIFEAQSNILSAAAKERKAKTTRPLAFAYYDRFSDRHEPYFGRGVMKRSLGSSDEREEGSKKQRGTSSSSSQVDQPDSSSGHLTPAPAHACSSSAAVSAPAVPASSSSTSDASPTSSSSLTGLKSRWATPAYASTDEDDEYEELIPVSSVEAVPKVPSVHFSPLPDNSSSASTSPAAVTQPEPVVVLQRSNVEPAATPGKASKLPARMLKNVASSEVEEFRICDIVMAKFKNYPYWPGIVIRGQGSSKKRPGETVCVKFWEGLRENMKTSYAEVPQDSVRPWSGRQAAQSLVPKNKRRRDWLFAVQFASEMEGLSPEERIWKVVLVEEKKDVHLSFNPDKNSADKTEARVGDVVIVGRKNFDLAVVTDEDSFSDTLGRSLYLVSGLVHVSFKEDGTHGWYPRDEVWTMGKSVGDLWPAKGKKARRSLELAQNLMNISKEKRIEVTMSHLYKPPYFYPE